MLCRHSSTATRLSGRRGPDKGGGDFTGMMGMARRTRGHDDLEVGEPERASGKLPSQYAVLARSTTHLAGLAENPRWYTA